MNPTPSHAPKRYNLSQYGMNEVPRGTYVFFSDYELVKKQRDDLVKENKRLANGLREALGTNLGLAVTNAELLSERDKLQIESKGNAEARDTWMELARERKTKLDDLRFGVSMKASQYRGQIPPELYVKLFDLTKEAKE